MNVSDSQLARSADEDLAAAERAAAVVGMQAASIVALRAQLAAGADLTVVAEEASELRASLVAAERQRAALLERWSSIPALLDSLAALEVAVRALVATCEQRQALPPRTNVPSVAATRQDVLALATEDLSSLTWPALRARLSPLVVAVDRSEAALRELEQRCHVLLSEDHA